LRRAIRRPLRSRRLHPPRCPGGWHRHRSPGPDTARGRGQEVGVIATQFLILAAALFSLGVYGLLVRRNAVLVLLSVELMLAAVNINLVVFEAMWRTSEAIGQVFSLFVIAVAAAEVGIGLSIILMIFRNRQSANVDELDLMRW